MPRTRGLQQYCCAIYSSSSRTAVPFFQVLVHTLCEGARPTQGLILSRVRRRDMDISFDSGEGSSASDSVRLVSMPTTGNSTVLRCRVRMRGLGGRMEVCEFAICCERARELRDAARKKATIKYRPDFAPIIAKGLATYLHFI